MLELNLTKNNNSVSKTYGYYYPMVELKEQYDVDRLAAHMAKHNTPFSGGTIAGILKDAVKCIRELTLEGHTVKIANLAIFKCSVEGNGCQVLYDAESDTIIRAAIGQLKKGQKTGPAVKSVKMLAQATGDYTRAELNKEAVLGWTKAARMQIDAVREASATSDAEPGDGGNG